MATRVFITGMATVGCVCLVFAGAHWQSGDPVKFALLSDCGPAGVVAES